MTQQPATVLIAEDDPVFRRVMSFSISRHGLTVESVCNGAEAYSRLAQGGIDFMIIDHQMPICSGLELLEKLLANPNVCQPPTILCTAKGLELDSHGIQSRFNLVDVMHKPFSPRRLSDLISQYIGDAGRTVQRPDAASPPAVDAPDSAAASDG
jgi:CheY-like chemotaxis protein